MTITELTTLISYYYDYSSYCISQPNPVDCEKFYGISYITGLVLSSLLFYISAKIFFQERKEWRDFLKRQEERNKIADDETMSSHIWNGEPY